ECDVQPVVPEDRQGGGCGRTDYGDEHRVPAPDAVEAGLQDHRLEHVERHQGDDDRQRGHDDTAVTELGASLNHLRQTEFGTLRAVKRHEEAPNTRPRAPATTVHSTESPSDGPTKPSAIEKKLKLVTNQNGPWRQTLPLRSSAGM